jgi:hypothetical protein
MVANIDVSSHLSNIWVGGSTEIEGESHVQPIPSFIKTELLQTQTKLAYHQIDANC